MLLLATNITLSSNLAQGHRGWIFRHIKPVLGAGPHDLIRESRARKTWQYPLRIEGAPSEERIIQLLEDVSST